MSEKVHLHRATPDLSPLLCNLLELYIHDLSQFFPIEPGPDGRFGYGKLPLYWSEPELRHAFLIKLGNRVVGFALATRGSPASSNPQDLDVAEFFVLRAYRHRSVGRQAATALWDMLPGHWVVRVSNANKAGLSFWTQAISRYTAGVFAQCKGSGHLSGWRIFNFDSTLAADSA
ncbi:MAG: GNAT family N-acetyltransferase [Pseudomonadota bacterium]